MNGFNTIFTRIPRASVERIYSISTKSYENSGGDVSREKAPHVACQNDSDLIIYLSVDVILKNEY
jgi:hypothetical protein